MLTGVSQDWPLSRDEKKHRLLCLYDQDLKETDYLLQLSARRHSLPSDLHAADSQENFGGSSIECPAAAAAAAAAPIKTPGDIEEQGSCRPLAEKERLVDSLCPSPADPSVKTPRRVDSDLIVAQCKAEPSEDTPYTHRSVATDVAPYTQRSVRSGATEYFTPDATPRTPTASGYCSSLGSVLAGSPALALRGSTSRLPPAALRGAGKAGLPPRPVPVAVPVALEKSRSSSSSRLHARRPRSAAAGNHSATAVSRSAAAGNRSVAAGSRSAAAGSAFAAYASSRDFPQSCFEAPVKDEFYPPQILSAARHGRRAPVEAALMGGLSPNYADEYGNTLFHIACQNGSKRVAKVVVKYGCDMNAQNSKGNTGLHFLFAYGYPDLGEYFIKKGADENVRNGLGNAARQGIK